MKYLQAKRLWVVGVLYYTDFTYEIAADYAAGLKR